MSWLSVELQSERDRLAIAFPLIFQGTHPWASNIRDQIMRCLPQGCSIERTDAVLQWVMRSEYYLRILLTGGTRRDCYGKETIPPSAEEISHAKKLLNDIARKRLILTREHREQKRKIPPARH